MASLVSTTRQLQNSRPRGPKQDLTPLINRGQLVMLFPMRIIAVAAIYKE